jgi:hypothetical protein
MQHSQQLVTYPVTFRENQQSTQMSAIYIQRANEEIKLTRTMRG